MGFTWRAGVLHTPVRTSAERRRKWAAESTLELLGRGNPRGGRRATVNQSPHVLDTCWVQEQSPCQHE